MNVKLYKVSTVGLELLTWSRNH